MKNNNLFDGESYYAMFAQVTYKWLISRKWFTYADIMADYLGLKSANELTCSISKCDNYGELRKALPDVLKAIENKVGKGGIEVKGNNGGRSYRYVGEDADPLADMRNAKTINDLRRYWQFCQDSSGFFPISWLEYFFKHKQYDYKKLLLWAWLAPITMGGVLELLQAYCTFGHRNGDWLDFAANTTGCTLIGIIGFAITAIMKKRPISPK